MAVGEDGAPDEGAADLPARLATIAGFAEELASPDFAVGRWHADEHVGDTLQMPWHELDPRAEAFVSALAGIMIVGFDWMRWAETAEGRRLLDDPGAIHGATSTQLRRLATALVRHDRFSEGSLAESFESGRMLAIARRAAALGAGSG